MVIKIKHVIRERKLTDSRIKVYASIFREMFPRQSHCLSVSTFVCVCVALCCLGTCFNLRWAVPGDQCSMILTIVVSCVLLEIF